ncbi:MAG: hypothetical protein O2931_01800 [Planctomycetota bacterium]|nr:hypothetical protein [Planctomycetota bacterium]MDA1177507.1 hypothetical protein [Planctomycetota bacterium]
MNAHAKFLLRDRVIRRLSVTGSLCLHLLLILGMATLGARSAWRGLTRTNPGPLVFSAAISDRDESLSLAELPAPVAIGSLDHGGEPGSAGEMVPIKLESPIQVDSFVPPSPVRLPSPSASGPGTVVEGLEPAPTRGLRGSSPRRGQNKGRGGQGVGEGSSVRTRVFGIEAEGSRFVYVFDRSGSMVSHQGRPLAQAKAELLRSLEDLQSVHQFQIIFYNEKPQLFNPRGGIASLLWADPANKQDAQEFVLDIQAAGGTHHLDALRMALKMGPDVIFFLTDADEPRMSRAHLDEVQRANQGTQVHTIEFGDGQRSGGRNFLMDLAEENGGQHVYVDMLRSALPRP